MPRLRASRVMWCNSLTKIARRRRKLIGHSLKKMVGRRKRLPHGSSSGGLPFLGLDHGDEDIFHRRSDRLEPRDCDALAFERLADARRGRLGIVYGDVEAAAEY